MWQIAQSESDEENYDEEEDFDDEDDDGEGYINLSDMLDMNHDEPAPSNNKQQSASKKRKIDELFNDDEDEDDEDEDDDDDDMDEEVDDVKHASLLKAVTGTSEPSKKKRRVVHEQTSARSEGEFNLQGAEISDNQSRDQLSLSHLVRALEPKGAGGVYARMREVSQQLQRADTSQVTRVTAPPANNVARSRVQREVAFDVVKGQLDEWTSTVQSLRRAPSLDFTKSDGTFDGVGVSKAILHRHSHNLTALVNNSALATAKRVMTEDAKKGNKDETGSIDLEEEVRAIMAESLREPSEMAGDAMIGSDEDSDNDLHHRPVDLEQIKARQAELAKMRSAMFFQEKKLKRLARIKSKKYRKILKKAKERKQMTLEEMRELDPEAAAEEEEKLDRQRALERVTLKHKQASKWAQHARHSQNPLMKKDLEEHYRLGQELKKKIRGEQGSDSDGSSAGDSFEQGEASDEELAQIEQEIAQHNKTAPTGLMAMRFMQRGAERQAEEARDLIRQIRDEERTHKRKLDAKARELHGEDDELPADSDEDVPKNRVAEDSDDSESEVNESAIQGRRGFTRPRGADQSRDHVEGAEVDLIGDSHQTHDVMLGSAFTSEFDPSKNSSSAKDKKREHLFNVNSKSPLPAPTKSGKNKTEAKNSAVQSEPVDERSVRVKVNADKFSKGVAPVLDGDEEAEPFAAMDEDDGIISLNSNAKSGSATKSKNTKRTSDVSNPWISQKNDDDTPVKSKNSSKKENKLQISEAINAVAGTEAVEGETKKKKKKQNKKKMTKIALDSDEEAETNSFDENNEPENLLASRDKRQQELISRAFETDDVETEFYKEKEAQIREELPDHVKDESLKIEFMPGWGSWSGAGIDESKKKMTRRQKNLLATRDAEEEKARDQRVDKNLKHVIISGRQDKKTVKYQVAQQPFPYQSRDVYEKAMRHPIGKEWNPQETFKKMVEPKVKTKAGVVIAPITRKIKPL